MTASLAPSRTALLQWDQPFAFPSAAAAELFNTLVSGNPVKIDRLKELPWSSDPTDRLSAAFMTLAVQRRFTLVPELLAFGVSPNAVRFNPRTSGDKPRSMLNQPALPTSVLREALKAAPSLVIRQLVSAGATWDRWENAGLDPLMVVVQAPRPMWIEHDRFRAEQVERFEACLDLGFVPLPSTLINAVPEAVANNVLPVVVERWVALGADPHALRRGQISALHLAVFYAQRSQHVAPLLGWGLDPHAQNEDGMTALRLLENRLAWEQYPSEDDRANLARLQALELRRTLSHEPAVGLNRPARNRL